MNWEAVGSIGEIVGAIAVVATLVYLAIQVRHSKNLIEENKKISLGQAFQTRAALRVQAAHEFMDPAWAAIRVKLYGGFSGVLPESLGENFERLSDAEKFQVMSYCEAIVNSIDNVLYQRELGLLNEVDVVALENHIVEQSALWKLSTCHIPRRVAAVYERKGRAGGD